jgi:nicotinate-nucleotide pyrophosphorylase (carboxylating)
MSTPVDVDAPAEVVRDAVRRALAEDLGPLGDLTASLVPAEASACADVVARVDGVLAGAACATEVFAQLDTAVVVSWLARDGARLAPGTVVGHVSGPLRSVLTGERTALNFLCHLSGVATMTRRFVDASGDRLQVWDTRKTLPGLRALEKAAVRAGGGVNHRGSLSDMVLLKDNHLAGVSIADAVRSALARWPGRAVEVECDRIDQVDEALAAGATMVLLDNMTPEQVRACVELVDGRVLVEVSGGVTIENVGAYAGTGADLVSTSVITQSAPALDLAFDMTVAT